jgi:2-polyprenyl-6-methoxyphenol hydroxylase-like FAD-dependent oxidoreductase
MKITIAGAGIAGLVTALALDADGHDIEIFEAVQEIKPLGVGINLLPHAAAVLNGLGVLDDLLKSGVATSELGYFNRYGQKIWSESRGLYAGQNAPQVSIARG